MRHTLFGLCVRSEIKLPLPQARSTGPVDVDVMLGRVHPGPTTVWQIEDPLEFTCTRSATEIVLDWPGMRYGVSAKRVVVDSQHMRSAVIPLLQAVWSVVLTMNGREAIHASVVAKGDVAVAVVGASGSGKSTAALALLDRGWSLVADDVLTLDAHGNAVPGPPFIRLTPERAEGRVGEWDVTGKLRYSPRLATEPVRPVAIFVHGDMFTSIRQLSGMESIDALLSNIYNDVLMVPGQAAQRLDFCAALARSASVYGVPPRSLSAEEIERVVERELVVT